MEKHLFTGTGSLSRFILRRDRIRGLRHEGLGVWSVEMDDGEELRIGRTYLRKVKAMAGR